MNDVSLQSKQLRRLSNAELENSMSVHVRNERLSLENIYAHINEVYRRELHLDIEFGSMKNYLIKRWKYSEREAYRKIEGARLLKDVPALANEIQNGNVNADVIGELSRAVKEKERSTGEKVTAEAKSDLLKMVIGKTVNESQKELALALDIQVKQFESKRVQKDNSVRLEHSVSEEVYANLNLCRDYASHKMQQEKLPNNLESMLKILTDYYIKGNKLKDHTEVKQARATKVISNSNRHGADDCTAIADQNYKSTDSVEPKLKKVNKTVTPKIRREVFKRDKCCQYKNEETGNLCGETAFAQVDHKIPLWAGGTNDLDNLQQLCANHNRRKYRKEAQLSWL